MSDLIYCPMCECEHENNSWCQAPSPDFGDCDQITCYEDIRGI